MSGRMLGGMSRLQTSRSIMAFDFALRRWIDSQCRHVGPCDPGRIVRLRAELYFLLLSVLR
jgi:hypothetical protein